MASKIYDSIPNITTILYAFKTNFPALRIGQIIDNFHNYVKSHQIDPFYLTDAEYASWFVNYYFYVRDENK